MARTILSPQRLTEIKRTNIGRIVIFCEGKTEKYYFEYFAEIIRKNKYTNVEVVLECANGNARTVLNCAADFLKREENARKYANYGKYLAFDCDDPEDIQGVISDSDGYELLISNYLFEIWLLMHFEEISEDITKREIYRRLSSHLRDSYSKGHKGKTREIIQNGDVGKAIDNANKIEQKYKALGCEVSKNIRDMNPYTSVHKLIEQFMAEIS